MSIETSTFIKKNGKYSCSNDFSSFYLPLKALVLIQLPFDCVT